MAPVFGAMQVAAGLSIPILQHGDLGNPDLHRLIGGVALVYGGGWFISALLIADGLMLRRILSRSELVRYLALIAVIAVAVGFLLPGMLLMVGYPLTACAILVCGFVYRKRRGAGEERQKVPS